MRRIEIAFMIVSLLLLGEVTIQAEPVYHQTMNANWLMNNAIFPSRTPQLASGGDAIRFGAGDYDRVYDVLLEVPLIAAGTVSSGARIAFNIHADPLPSMNPSYSEDEELHVGITDGTSVITWTRADNDNGTGAAFEGEYSSPQAVLQHGYTLFNNVGRPSDFSAVFALEEFETVVWGQLGLGTGTHTCLRLISPDSALSLIVLGDNGYEQYQISSIDVTITPEPATLLLLGLGGLALRRGRK